MITKIIVTQTWIIQYYSSGATSNVSNPIVIDINSNTGTSSKGINKGLELFLFKTFICKISQILNPLFYETPFICSE